MNKFKVLRVQKGITQVELAKILNVQQTTISKWEQDRATPDYPTLTKLADYFGVSVDYLLGRETPKTEERPLPTKERSYHEQLIDKLSDAQLEKLYAYLQGLIDGKN